MIGFALKEVSFRHNRKIGEVVQGLEVIKAMRKLKNGYGAQSDANDLKIIDCGIIDPKTNEPMRQYSEYDKKFKE